MLSKHYQPNLIATSLSGPVRDLDVSAKLSEDGTTLVVQVVSLNEDTVELDLELSRFNPKQPTATVEVLAGPLDAANSAANPTRTQPERSTWTHRIDQGRTHLKLPPYSISIVTFE